MLLAVGCAGHAGRTAPPEAVATGWVQEALVGEVAGDLERLQALGDAGPPERVVRLDRLLDLFDAARFGEDEYARETLWAALGGHPAGIGTAATRDAIRLLLEEALAIEAMTQESEAEASAPDADQIAFLTDAIMLLSTDLQQPATADDLSIRTLAYRELVYRGHARITDNARWRLYDHVRGTLAGATSAAPEHRLDVAVQALYARHESVEPWLQDVAPHARPAAPVPDTLWAVLEEQRAALAQDPRWMPVLQIRADADAGLRDTVVSVLPAPRDTTWPMPELPRGVARPESGAPAVIAEAGAVRIDAGRPQERRLPLQADVADLADALQGALAQDGRGVLLLSVDPVLPSPELHHLLRGIRRAQTSSLELAVREPRIDDGEPVVVALPLHVARSADATVGTQALVQARVSVHLTGRGPHFAVDGQPLGPSVADPADLPGTVARLRRAYPRERIVRLTLSSDVLYQQLVDLLVALEGGQDPAFGSVGWWAGGGPPQGDPSAAHDARLRRRAALGIRDPQVRIDQPYPLQEDDQARLESFAKRAAGCLPELEVELPKDAGRIAVRLRFEERVLASVEPIRVRAPAARIEALAECVQEEALGLRLRGHKERLQIEVSYARR